MIIVSDNDATWKGTHISEFQTSLNLPQFPELFNCDEHAVLVQVVPKLSNQARCDLRNSSSWILDSYRCWRSARLFSTTSRSNWLLGSESRETSLFRKKCDRSKFLLLNYSLFIWEWFFHKYISNVGSNQPMEFDKRCS